MQRLPPRPQLVDQVYDSLLSAICDRRLAPGARLAQEDLAARLAVSRQPVSQALQLLKQQGFVADAGRRGLVVAPVDPDYLRATYEVRAALDALAAAGAARRVAEGDRSGAALIARGRQVLADGRAAVAAGDRAAMVAADGAFHGVVNALSGNPVVAAIAEQQWCHIRRAMGAVLDDVALRRRVWDEHAAILDAIAAGDAAAAEERAGAHARHAGHATWRRLIEETGEEARHGSAA